MKNLKALSLEFIDDQLYILDQQLLPHTEKLIQVKNVDHMVEIIKKLKVRGAPAIGVSAALAFAQFAKTEPNKDTLRAIAHKLRESRPTAVNLMICIDSMLTKLEVKNYQEALMFEAVRLFEEDVQLCLKMGENGASLIEDGDNILTHCNTGGLATVGIGTALSCIKIAHDQGKKIHVYVDETRPLLQGARLTTWELNKWNIPYTLITDNMAAHLMSKGKIQKVFIGSDRVAVNGDFANKIGTYSIAIAAKYHNIPFYPVAPYTTIDFNCMNGEEIPIEQRKDDEVRGVSGSFGDVCWAPHDAPTENPAFDVTPVELVTALVLDRGIYRKDDFPLS